MIKTIITVLAFVYGAGCLFMAVNLYRNRVPPPRDFDLIKKIVAEILIAFYIILWPITFPIALKKFWNKK